MAKHKPRRQPRATPAVSSAKALAGLELAAALIERGNMAEARRVLEALHHRYPGRVDVLNNLAYAYHQLGDLPEYLACCIKLCRLAPHQADYALALASAYALNERLVLALRTYQRFLERWPAHAQAGDVRSKVDQLEPGMRDMTAEAGLSGADGLEAAAMHEEVQILLAQGNYKEGYPLARQLIERQPGFAPVYNNLSQMLFLDNHAEEAIVTAQQVLPAGEIRMWAEGEWRDMLLLNMEISAAPVPTSLPAPARRLLEQALDKVHAGDGVEAERLLKEALSLAPREPSLLNNLAGAYQLQGRDAEYRQLVQQLHKQHPEYFFGCVQMAGIYTQRGEIDKAHEMLRPLLQRHKLHTSEMVALCSTQIALLLKEGRHDSARSWFGLLEQVSPEHPAVAALRPQVHKPAWRRMLDKPFGGR